MHHIAADTATAARGVSNLSWAIALALLTHSATGATIQQLWLTRMKLLLVSFGLTAVCPAGAVF